MDFEEGNGSGSPRLQLDGRGDVELHGGAAGHLRAAGAARWPRLRDGGELQLLRSSRGDVGEEGEEAPVGEMDRGGRPILHGAAKGRPAARQLPDSHAVAAGDLAACLAKEEDGLTPMGWAWPLLPVGPGGPEGKQVRFLSVFLFIAFCFICF